MHTRYTGGRFVGMVYMQEKQQANTDGNASENTKTWGGVFETKTERDTAKDRTVGMKGWEMETQTEQG